MAVNAFLLELKIAVCHTRLLSILVIQVNTSELIRSSIERTWRKVIYKMLRNALFGV